jgi:RNA polymerase sigma factor (sigma-70 family)
MIEALRLLTDEQRRVIVLRFFSGYSHAEIASVLAKREGAVRAQLLRALRQLRKVLYDAAP